MACLDAASSAASALWRTGGHELISPSVEALEVPERKLKYSLGRPNQSLAHPCLSHCHRVGGNRSRKSPLRPFSLHPGASVIHNGRPATCGTLWNPGGHGIVSSDPRVDLRISLEAGVSGPCIAETRAGAERGHCE